MLKLAGFVFCTAFSLLAYDTVTPIQQMGSQAPPGARYEVLEGTSSGRLRLDRFTGKTWRMSDVQQGSQWTSHWVELEFAGPPPSADGQPRYQITFGNGFPESVVLIDTTTGKTWRYLYDAANGKPLWKPVEEPGR